MLNKDTWLKEHDEHLRDMVRQLVFDLEESCPGSVSDLDEVEDNVFDQVKEIILNASWEKEVVVPLTEPYRTLKILISPETLPSVFDCETNASVA